MLFISSCSYNQQKNVNHINSIPVDSSKMRFSKTHKEEKSWAGNLGNDIPVFIHYYLDDSVIIGEITYLNTKNRVPIKVRGTIESNNHYKLLEFEKNGNITGVITGTPNDSIFKGVWFSPKSGKEIDFSLKRKDSVVNANMEDVNLSKIFGRYHYQYTETGYQGDITIKQLAGSKVAFGITSVTEDPARNVAQIEEDTITILGPYFTYKLPESTNCEFDVKFFKDFAFVKYGNGDCNGQFGLNATIEGLFLKVE